MTILLCSSLLLGVATPADEPVIMYSWTPGFIIAWTPEDVKRLPKRTLMFALWADGRVIWREGGDPWRSGPESFDSAATRFRYFPGTHYKGRVPAQTVSYALEQLSKAGALDVDDWGLWPVDSSHFTLEVKWFGRRMTLSHWNLEPPDTCPYDADPNEFALQRGAWLLTNAWMRRLTPLAGPKIPTPCLDDLNAPRKALLVPPFEGVPWLEPRHPSFSEWRRSG